MQEQSNFDLIPYENRELRKTKQRLERNQSHRIRLGEPFSKRLIYTPVHKLSYPTICRIELKVSSQNSVSEKCRICSQRDSNNRIECLACGGLQQYLPVSKKVCFSKALQNDEEHVSLLALLPASNGLKKVKRVGRTFAFEDEGKKEPLQRVSSLMLTEDDAN